MDDYAAKSIPKSVPIFVQNDSDKNILKSQGFKDVKIVGIDTPLKESQSLKMKENMELMKSYHISEEILAYVWALL